MGVNRIKKDSVAALKKRKTRTELQEENERLQAKVDTLEEQVGEQADALIELAGLLTGEEV